MNINDKIYNHVRLTTMQKNALEKLNLYTIEDLLMYVPQKYEYISDAMNIFSILSQKSSDEMVTVYGQLSDLEKKLSWKTKKYIIEAWLSDHTGKIKIRWFNQPYIANVFQYAKYVKVTAKLSFAGAQAYFANPIIETLPELPDLDIIQKNKQTPPYPIYKTTYGITSKWFYFTIRKVLNQIEAEQISDYIPEYILSKYNLPHIYTALIWAHMPKNKKDTEVARKRFAFQEVFCLQLISAMRRLKRDKKTTYAIKSDFRNKTGEIATIEDFIKLLPFKLTKSQMGAINSIISDMNNNKPMARLLEGDVGSGKTVVAATVTFAVVSNSLQVAYMAPTEILAQQLFGDFVKYFKNTDIKIGLLMGNSCFKYPSKINKGEVTKISKSQLLKWIKDGSINVIVGTHALIQKDVIFKKLGLAIIDEQHRFGTRQRANLLKNNLDGKTPHLLSMTATPIPRTLALTIYGDLDITVMDQMPKGRKKVLTKIVNKNKLTEVYEHMREQIKSGRQAYVICPKVSPSDLTTGNGELPSAQKVIMARIKNVEHEAETLKKIFPEFEISTLHGKMKPKEKDEIMKDFLANKTQILVATSVVEVGVNVPNATIILIEGAERFGLSQLHQLRGRVARSAHQAYCYLTTTNNTMSANTRERLNALVKAKNGFELAEKDLELRGAGELYGEQQWGQGDLAMEAIKNIKMVEAARESAYQLVKDNPDLSLYPLLKTYMSNKKQFHPE